VSPFLNDLRQSIDQPSLNIRRLQDAGWGICNGYIKMGGTFVGRQREMDELKAALEEAISGHGRLVMLVGEPGIGKTRTAQELANQAQELGAQVWWGRCYEEQGTPPYWPWVQAVRSYVREGDQEGLLAEMGAGASNIAEILPEVKEKLPDLPPPPGLDTPEYARFRLFDSIATFLKVVSRIQPLVLVLDDLHWADKPSLLLFQFMATEIANSRLMLLGTYRDVELSRQHPLSETLAQLSREPVFRRIVLRGLSQDDTHRFVELTAGISPTSRLAQAIHSHTEGNPFFMGEVVRLLQERGELSDKYASLPQGMRIPEGVREVIGQRLNRLSQQCNEALTLASVIGREFSFDQLRSLVDDLTEDRLLGVVEEALAGRVIEELPQAVGSYQFAHPLIQETLLEELSLTRRVRLHARIAEVLEKLYGNQAEAHAAELAHHFGQTEAMLGSEKVVKYSLLAGERALAAYAWEEAEAHFQRGLDAKEGQPMDTEKARLFVGLGHAQLAILPRDQRRNALLTLTQVFDYFIETGDLDRAVAVALSQWPDSSWLDSLLGRDIKALIERALQLVPPDSHQAGRLLAIYAEALGAGQGDYNSALAAVNRALLIARRENDPVLEMRALSYALRIDAFNAQYKLCLEKSRGVIELARYNRDLRADLTSSSWAARCLAILGSADEASLHAAASLATAERLRDRFAIDTALLDMGDLSLLRGHWEMARGYFDRGLEVSPGDTRLLYHRAVLEYEVGDFQQGGIYLESLMEAVRSTPPIPSHDYAGLALTIATVAYLTGETGRFDVAEAAANMVLSSPTAPPRLVHLARVGLGLIAIQRGDIAAASRQYNALQSIRGMMLQSSFICFDHLLGLLAETQGDLDQTMAHFEDALAFCRKAGYRPELAWTCHDYAETLLVRAGLKPVLTPANLERARTLLDEALAISTELGMRPLTERVQALQKKVAVQPAPAPTYPDGLTGREVEVLHLIALGRSNPEIGQGLFISPNTVAHHVTNILNKTNTANRTEAAAYAGQHGLI
jgi:DNA-binding CsgD family transcriptional regulator/tetratricopeptide (TPR) repeat protein